MQQTVYIDVLLILNLFVNYFILLLVQKINRIQGSLGRLFLGAAVGAALSFVIFVPEVHFLLPYLINLGVAAVVSWATWGFRSLKRYIRMVASLYIATFLYGGFMMGIWLLLRPQGMVINNGVVYFNISPLFLLLSTAAIYLIVTLIYRSFKRVRSDKEFYEVEIILGNTSVKLTALLDTGNTLTDLFSDMPVVVAEYSYIRGILPAASADAFLSENIGCIPEQMEDKYRLIPYSAVGGQGMLPAFRPDLVRLSNGKRRQEIRRCLIAVTQESLGGDYHALIGSEICKEEMSEDVRLEKVQK